jgi:hypothetical protein
LAVAAATLILLAALCLAAFYDDFDLSLMQIWAIVVLAPVIAGAAVYLLAQRFEPAVKLDPRSSEDRPAPETPVAAPATSIPPTPPPAIESQPAVATAAAVTPRGEGRTRHTFMPFPTVGERGERALDSVVTSLHELGELAPLIRQTDDPDELIEILTYIESLRLGLADSNQTLIGVVRSEEEIDRARET